MIEKLGAEYVGTEETLIQRSIRLMKERFGEEDYEKMRETYQIEYGMSVEEQEEVVYIYRLMPELYL